jgi:tetratricopeptide (TPR) repeat protein
MTFDVEFLGMLAEIAALDQLKEHRRYDELASRAASLLSRLGEPSGADPVRDAYLGTVASFGAYATYEQANYPETMVFAERQVAAGRTISGASVTLVRGLNWRALAHEAIGRLTLAAADYREGLAVAERLDPPNQQVADEIRLNYLDLRVKRGEYEAISDLATRPSLISPTDEVANDFALVELNRMGYAAIQAGQFETGIAMMAKVMDQALSADNNRLAGVAASNIGQALYDSEGPAAALPFMDKACTLLSHPGMGEQFAVAAYNRGMVHRDTGNTKEAITSFKEAWDALRREAPRSVRTLPVLHELALQRMAARDFPRARAALSRGLQIYESLRTEVGLREHEHEGALRSYRSLLELHLFLSLNDGWADEATALIERGKARFWLESIAALKAGDLPALSEPEEEPAPLVASLPVTSRGVLVLSYFVGLNATFAVMGKPANPRVRRIGKGEGQLSELVEEMTFELLASASRAGRTDSSAVSLSRLLLDDFDPADAQALLLLPDGPLWALPFDALPLAGGGVLGDRVPTVVAPTVSVISQLQSRARSPRGPQHWRMLAVGSPAAGPEFPPIPGTAGQVAAIAGLIPGTVSLTGSAAGRQQLTHHLRTATHVHIAAHAFGTPDDYLPHIVLSDGLGGPDRLYAAEIARLSMQADLVFLSACSTSVGRLSVGEGVVSVGRAFVLAGARCVIATLWPIEDTEAVDLVSFFYARLREGAPPAEAAIQARRNAVEHDADPRAWAGLQVIGDGLAGLNSVTCA